MNLPQTLKKLKAHLAIIEDNPGAFDAHKELRHDALVALPKLIECLEEAMEALKLYANKYNWVPEDDLKFNTLIEQYYGYKTAREVLEKYGIE